jgi:hypothetical protein
LPPFTQCSAIFTIAVFFRSQSPRPSLSFQRAHIINQRCLTGPYPISATVSAG